MMMYMYMNFVSIMLMLIMVLVGIAYVTLLERKILGYIHNRKGPNKLGILGLLQPFSDAIKLFNNELLAMGKMNLWLFYFSSLIFFFNMLILWLLFVYYTNIYYLNYSILMIVMILSMNSYIGMIMGWSSNSLYSMIGSVRLIVQVLSYEVSLVMILFVEMVLSESYNLMDLIKWQYYMWFVWALLPVVMIFFISILAELNRSPVDLVEGESELVSGFNVEYFSGSFGLIFMSEYGMIIFMLYMMMFLFFGSSNIYMLFMGLMLLFFIVIFLRGIMPRMRYDNLMYLCWKIVLLVVLNYLLIVILIKIMMTYYM